MSDSREPAADQPPIPAYNPSRWPRVPIGLPNDVSVREFVETVIAMNDRRYAEVNVEKEKALKIKETADLAALQLAREIQSYKDEKANELREQISSERGLYATKNDLAAMSDKFDSAMKPVAEFISASNARLGTTQEHSQSTARNLNNRLVALGVTVSFVVVLVNVLVFFAAGH